MKIVKLTKKHTKAVKGLFKSEKHMGIGGFSNHSGMDDFDELQYTVFCDTYLSDLNNFHAFGAINDKNKVVAAVSFYESNEEPSWYFTQYRSTGNGFLIRDILDEIIKYNEANGRLKFYTLITDRYSRLLRRFGWSQYNTERYGYFDEYIVPEKCRPFYNTHWEILYKRMLMPANTIVRCSFLKQEYREQLPLGGNI